MEAQRHADEEAFSLIEVIVALLIIAIVMSIGILSVRSAKATGARMDAAAAGKLYADAIDRFQQENGRRLPRISAGSDTWPSESVNSGPIRTVKIGSNPAVVTHYLEGGQPPEIMRRAGTHRLEISELAGSSCSIPAAGGRLIYRTGPAPAGRCTPALRTGQFNIRVFWNNKAVCDAGSGAPHETRC